MISSLRFKKYKPLTILLLFLIFTAFIKEFLWMGLVPVWHFPDEISHYSQIQNTAQYGLTTPYQTSEEVAQSDQLLGLYHNSQGGNRFIYSASEAVFFNNETEGFNEKAIKALSHRYVPSQSLSIATQYPFLYYWLGSLIESPFRNTDLITRIFILRIFSIFIFTATVFVGYRIGETVFGKQSLLAFGLAVLLAFQPMFSYMGAAVNSDSLFILLFSILIYAGLNIIKGSTLKHWLMVIAAIGLGLITKQQMAISLLIILPLTLVLAWRRRNLVLANLKYIIPALAVGIFVVILGAQFGNLSFLYTLIRLDNVNGLVVGFNSPDFLTFLGSTLTRFYREVLPWYWGSFKWLHVILPRNVNRIQMLLVVLSVLGLLWHFGCAFWRKFTQHSSLSLYTKLLGFCVFASLVYYGAVTLWDFQHYRTYGYSFGIQARYFFPVITCHMLLMLAGLHQLSELVLKKFAHIGVKVLMSWWIILQGIGLYVLAAAYYDLSSWNSFLIQASQYKPWYFKGEWWGVWVGVSGVLTLGIFWVLIKYKGIKNNNSMSFRVK